MPVYTLKFPLDVVSKRDTFDVLDENNIKEVVKFNIKSTILTCPGERRGDPNFGVCAKSYLFDQNVFDYSQLRTEILTQVQEYVPYCFIEDLIVESDEDSNTLLITMTYVISEINKKDTFELSIST
jgi:hypothetical protein